MSGQLWQRLSLGSRSNSFGLFFVNKMVKKTEFVTERVSVRNVHEAPSDKVVKSGENGLYFEKKRELEDSEQSKADPLTDDHQFYGDGEESGDLYCENKEASFEMDEVGEDDECPWCGNPVSVFGRIDKSLDIHDHVKIWLRDPDNAPDDSTVIEASESAPAGCTHYYFDLSFADEKEDSYPEVPHEDSPPEVKEAVRRFKQEVPDDEKEDTPLLYWLLGTGTPEYKMSKKDAAYKEEPEDDMVCSNCQYYYEGVDGEAVCSKVRGQVYPEHWCRLWAPADTQQEKEDGGTWEISTVEGIEGYQHSETGEFIPALNADTTMVADLSEKDEDGDSVDGWVPYVGPQGGHGWTNGESVSYDEEPPGDTAIDQLSQEQKGDLRQKLLDKGMDEVDELLYDEGEAIPLEHRQEGETVILQKGGISEYEIDEIKIGGPGPDMAIIEDSFDKYSVASDQFEDKSVKIHSEPDGLSQFMPVSIEGWSSVGYDDEDTTEITLKDSIDGHIDIPGSGSFLTESEEHGMLVTQDTMKEDAEYVHPEAGEVTYTGEDESYGEYVMETEDGEEFIYDNSEDIMYQKVDVSPQEPSYDLEYLGAFDIDVIETTVDEIVENNPVGVDTVETTKDIDAIAQFNYNAGKMEINPDHFSNRDELDKRANKMQEDGFLTGEGDAQEHVLRHEVGHAMHAQMGVESVDAKKMKYSQEEKEYVKENFGEYASANPGELVAEVLSLMLDGVDIKEEYPKIYELYLEYQGPEQEEVNPI